MLLRDLDPAHAPRPRYAPVMKFERSHDGADYVAYRMTYTRDCDWMPLHQGSLQRLVAMVRAIGTDEFFELF